MARRWLRRKDPNAEWRRPQDSRESPPGSAGPGASSASQTQAAGQDEWQRPSDQAWRPDFKEGSPGPTIDQTVEGELLPQDREPVLAAEELVRTYPGRVGVAALRGVTMGVRPGEFLALMGPSGSGKSTLLGLLAGLDRPGEGRVLWRGRPIDGLSHRELLVLRRKSLGMVFQNFGLLPTLSALENVELPMRVAGARLDRASRAAIQWLTRLGLDDRLHNRTFELSAGQQQRVAVARALVIEPEVVLADEPIAEVDTENADLILDALADVARRGGAVIAATHNPEALEYANRVVLLRDGKIEATGSPEEIAGRLGTD
jgi:putative ABC transport system ATP-binding protein